MDYFELKKTEGDPVIGVLLRPCFWHKERKRDYFETYQDILYIFKRSAFTRN